MFVYIRARFRFALIGEVWPLSRRGATGELEARRQSAPESLLAGYSIPRCGRPSPTVGGTVTGPH